jgi:hypothetical protein
LTFTFFVPPVCNAAGGLCVGPTLLRLGLVNERSEGAAVEKVVPEVLAAGHDNRLKG